MAVDIVHGARGSLARTAAILQSALRAAGPTLGDPGRCVSGGGISLSCPTQGGQGEIGKGKQNCLCPQDTGNTGRCSVMAMEQVPSGLCPPCSVIQESVGQYLLSTDYVPGTGLDTVVNKAEQVPAPRELMSLVGGRHKNT